MLWRQIAIKLINGNLFFHELSPQLYLFFNAAYILDSVTTSLLYTVNKQKNKQTNKATNKKSDVGGYIHHIHLAQPVSSSSVVTSARFSLVQWPFMAKPDDDDDDETNNQQLSFNRLTIVAVIKAIVDGNDRDNKNSY